MDARGVDGDVQKLLKVFCTLPRSFGAELKKINRLGVGRPQNVIIAYAWPCCAPYEIHDPAYKGRLRARGCKRGPLRTEETEMLKHQCGQVYGLPSR